MFRILFASLMAGFVTPVASGQVFYQPVQYQYGPCPTFYYGGNDPAVIERAARSAAVDYGSSETGYREGKPGVGLIHPGLIGQPAFHVYTDAIRDNAAVYGYTPADARNEANARAPRYFTKTDLLASAVPSFEPGYFSMHDIIGPARPRVMVVPAQPLAAGMIEIHRTGHPVMNPSQPRTEPQPILIIPKKLLEQPSPEKSVATR